MHNGNIFNIRIITLYTQWTAFCTDLKLDQLLEDPNLPSANILQVYGHWVHLNHYYSQSKRLKADWVTTVWRDIAVAHLLEGHRDPRKPHGYHAKDLNNRLTKMLRNFSYQDLLPKRVKLIPLGLFMVTVEAAAPYFPF